MCPQLWMLLPNFEDILAIKSVIRPDMSNDELQRRYDFVGPIPRQLFASNFDDDVLPILYSRIVDFNVGTFITSTMFNQGLLPKDTDHTKGLSWWIAHVSGPDNLSRKGLKICWASDKVKNLVLASQAKRDINVLKEISCRIIKDPPEVEKPSGYYERWCVHSLAGGAEMKPMIGDVFAETVQLPVAEIKEMSYMSN